MAFEAERILLKEVTLSFPYLLRKDDEGKIRTEILIPKGSEAAKVLVESMQRQALAVFGDAAKFSQTGQFKDGDLPNRKGKMREETKGHWCISAKYSEKSMRPLIIVDRQQNPIIDPTEIYAGVIANLNIAVSAYTSPTYGELFGLWLNVVQKVKDGTPIGGSGPSTEEVLAGMPTYADAAPPVPAPPSPAPQGVSTEMGTTGVDTPQPVHQQPAAAPSQPQNFAF